jgi:hypothetical protein
VRDVPKISNHSWHGSDTSIDFSMCYLIAFAHAAMRHFCSENYIVFVMARPFTSQNGPTHIEPTLHGALLDSRNLR